MSEPKRIQLRRTKGWRLPPNTVVVARPSKWGNPYGQWYLRFHFDVAKAVALYANTVRGIWNPVLLDACSNECVLEAYRDHHEWLRRIGLDVSARAVAELRGKDLACWCPLVDASGRPVPCHADVLIALANS